MHLERVGNVCVKVSFTQCAKDCGPYNYVFQYGRILTYNPWNMHTPVLCWSFFVCPIWLPVFFLFSIMNQNWVQKLILAWLWHHFHLALDRDRTVRFEPTTFWSWAKCSTARPQLSLVLCWSSSRILTLIPYFFCNLYSWRIKSTN